jgi:hypothetical protein
MRNPIFLHSAVLFLAALSPAVVGAQFQQPNPEELTMTSDPKAPGADAVYLEYREIDNSQSAYWTTYARIKVLTEKGKEAATISVPFLKGDMRVNAIHGRTIHSDGTIIPLIGKPEQLLGVKAGRLDIEKKVFTMPSVEVGSIIEYSYDLSSPYLGWPRWEVQKDYFVHKEHFEFMAPSDVPSSGTTYWARLPSTVAVKSGFDGFYKLDMSDVPPAPNEDWMPPSDSRLYMVNFHYWTPFNTGTIGADPEAFWSYEARVWSTAVDDLTAPSKELKQVADQLVSPSDSDLEKARKLYAAVEALDNTDFSRTKTQTERKKLKMKSEWRLEETWKLKSGSKDELALLYLALLHSEGLTAYAVEVVDRDKGVFDQTIVDPDEFDSTLVILESDGKQILLDPGDKMCPFQTVNWRHSLASGIGQSAKGPSSTTTPAQQYANNTERRTGILTLDASGGVSGQLQFTMTGQEALRWRQTALENDLSEVKKQFDDELAAIVPDGVQAHVDGFEAIDDPNANLIAMVNINGTLGVSTAKRLVIPGFFFETRGNIPFVNEEKRLEPVDMHYAERATDQITYRLPAGVTVEGAPQDANISWPNHALFVAKSLTQANQITTAQTLTRAFTLARPEEYSNLRGFYQKVAAADQAQLVLAIAPERKSN